MPAPPPVHFLNVKVLNMLDFRVHAIEGANNTDDIETIVGYVSIAEIMIDGMTQVVAFLVVNGFIRGAKVVAAASLYFHEHRGFSVLCNDVNVSMLGMPVAFKDDIALLTQVGRSELLSPGPRLYMFWSIFLKMLLCVALFHQLLAFFKSIFYPTVFVRNSW